ncbi:MAG: PH domain-containing protein [Planctomycetes bacterium]|nr:PH domain-containing protein [Planctomycetota bacterium]
MYELVKGAVGNLLKVPLDPPPPPAGAPGSVRVFRASRKWLHYRLLGWYIGLAVEIPFLMALAGGSIFTLKAIGVLLAVFALAVAAAFTFLSYCVTRLDYDLRYYQITDRSLRIREGALGIREVTITYANVQDVKISQGPLQQIFGISDLVVSTAGGGGTIRAEGADPWGGGHHGVFRGIENAEGLRDEILALLRRHRDAGLGDPDDRRRQALRPASPAGLTPLAAARLAGIRDELRAARQALEALPS